MYHAPDSGDQEQVGPAGAPDIDQDQIDQGLGDDLRLPSIPEAFSQEEILSQYSPEQQELLKEKLRLLKVLAGFIGKDYAMPVEFNQPGGGWHWDFQHNKIRIDPNNVLEEPLSFLRAIICHEGGHRRITRANFVSQELWQTPGFSFLLNAIEDPRNDNFVAEAYPRYREDLLETYSLIFEKEKAILEKAGSERPRFVTAGLEYIKYWFQEFQGLSPTLSDDLDDDVRAVLENTIDAARTAWRYYPSKTEADQGEYLVERYSKKAFRIIYDEVWPQFQTLVEKDLKDRALHSMGRDLLNREKKDEDAQGQGPGQGGTPQQANGQQQGNQSGGQGKLSANDIAELKKLADPQQNQGAGQQLSPELRKKLEEAYNALSEEEKERLKEEARKALQQLQEELAEELEGKLNEKNEEGQSQAKEGEEQRESETQQLSNLDAESRAAAGGIRIANRDLDFYREQRQEVAPKIRELESRVRKIFKARKQNHWHTGYKGGKRLDIRRRINEVARDVPAVNTKSWQKKVQPSEKDYAFGILVDLSGSMAGARVVRALRAAITVVEPLQKIGVTTAVYGFNSDLFEFKTFKDDLSPDTRSKMGTMTAIASGEGGAYTDDGWAITQLSEVLGKQPEGHKCMIVITDGSTNPSPAHRGPEFRLKHALDTVHNGTDQVVIGLGIGSGTGYVSDAYQFGQGNLSEDELPEVLARWLEDVIENIDRFKRGNE